MQALQDLLLELSLATNRQGQDCDPFTDEEIKPREAQSLAQVDLASSESRYASLQTPSVPTTHLVLSVSLSNSITTPFSWRPSQITPRQEATLLVGPLSFKLLFYKRGPYDTGFSI